MSTADSNILPFPSRPDAPITVLPSPAVKAGMEAAGAYSKRAEMVTAVSRAARAALDIASDGPQKRARAHASLHLAAAAKVEGLASALRTLAEELKALGHILPAHDLTQFAAKAELISVEIEADIP